MKERKSFTSTQKGFLLSIVLVTVPGSSNAGIDAIHDLHDEEDDEPHGQEEHDAAVEQARNDVARPIHDER